MGEGDVGGVDISNIRSGDFGDERILQHRHILQVAAFGMLLQNDRLLEVDGVEGVVVGVVAATLSTNDHLGKSR